MKNLLRIWYRFSDYSNKWTIFYRLSDWCTNIVKHNIQTYDVRNIIHLFDCFATNTFDLLCDNVVSINYDWRPWPQVRYN